MNMLDPTAAFNRAYSATLQAEFDGGAEDAAQAEFIASTMRLAWECGLYSAPVMGHNGFRSLAYHLSCAMCDVPGNPLYTVLDIVRESAAAGNAKAVELMQSMCQKHGRETVELMR